MKCFFKCFFFLHKFISGQFFILPEVSYTSKNFNTARTPTELKQNLLHWFFFFVKIFVSFVKLLNINLDKTHLFLRVAYLICKMLLKVNYIAADGISFICRAFKKSEMMLFCKYVEFHIIFSIDFLHSSLTQFFFIKVF